MSRPIDELGGIPGLPGHVRNVLLDHEGLGEDRKIPAAAGGNRSHETRA